KPIESDLRIRREHAFTRAGCALDRSKEHVRVCVHHAVDGARCLVECPEPPVQKNKELCGTNRAHCVRWESTGLRGTGRAVKRNAQRLRRRRLHVANELFASAVVFGWPLSRVDRARSLRQSAAVRFLQLWSKLNRTLLRGPRELRRHDVAARLLNRKICD